MATSQQPKIQQQGVVQDVESPAASPRDGHAAAADANGGGSARPPVPARRTFAVSSCLPCTGRGSAGGSAAHHSAPCTDPNTPEGSTSVSTSPNTAPALPFRDAVFGRKSKGKSNSPTSNSVVGAGHPGTGTASKGDAPPPEAQATGDELAGLPVWRAMLRRLRMASQATTVSTLQAFQASPSCWVVPLLCLAVILAAGVWSVLLSASNDVEHAKDVALAAAESAARAFELQLQAAYGPCITMALLPQLAPQWDDLKPMFRTVAAPLLSQVEGGSLFEIQFAPQGIIVDTYPDDPAAIGRNLFTDKERRAIVLETVSLGTLTVGGPLLLYRGVQGLVVRMPIYLDNQTANETYGMAHTASNCSACYDAATGRKFWGFSIGLISWDPLIGSTSQLDALSTQGYRWMLRQYNSSNPTQLITIAGSDDLPGAGADVAVVNVTLRAAGTSNLPPSFADNWYLMIVPRKGWTPAWRGPAIAGVVLGAFLVAFLVCLALVNRVHHMLAAKHLKESNDRLAQTTSNLSLEKQRLDALLERQYALLEIFGRESCSEKGPRSVSSESGTVERIEAVRRALGPNAAAPTSLPLQLQIQSLLGEGSFGKVYKGLWRGTQVAVKALVLPANMSGAEKREKMAVMEAAISSSLSHPNIVQTYTYSVKPMQDSTAHSMSGAGHDDGACSPLIVTSGSVSMAGSVLGVGGVRAAKGPHTSSAAQAMNGTASEAAGTSAAAPPDAAATPTNISRTLTPSSYSSFEVVPAKRGGTLSMRSNVHSYEVWLVLEYCDKGTLHDAVEGGAFFSAAGGLNYAAILETALDIAHAVAHLHSLDVLHGDLKARNVLLKSAGDPRGVTAKVGDFGLSVKMDSNATHVSSTFQGTLTHMAPEVMLHGQLSKAADVYAFGMTMFELFTGTAPYQGVPGALLGHLISHEGRRPAFPPVTPAEYRGLAERCWQASPTDRPTFEEITQELERLRGELGGVTPPLMIQDAKAPASPARVSANGTGGASINSVGGRVGDKSGAAALPASRLSSGSSGGTSMLRKATFPATPRQLEPLPEVPEQDGSPTIAQRAAKHSPRVPPNPRLAPSPLPSPRMPSPLVPSPLPSPRAPPAMLPAPLPTPRSTSKSPGRVRFEQSAALAAGYAAGHTNGVGVSRSHLIHGSVLVTGSVSGSFDLAASPALIIGDGDTERRSLDRADKEGEIVHASNGSSPAGKGWDIPAFRTSAGLHPIDEDGGRTSNGGGPKHV